MEIIFDAKITKVESMGKKLRVASVKIYKNKILVDSAVTQKGKCKFKLDTGAIYKITFDKSGYYGKYLLIDTHELPSDYKKKSKIKVDVGLFRKKKYLDAGFLEEKAIGIAAYDFILNKIAWDVEYTQQIIEEIIKATVDYSAKKEKGKRKSL